MLRKLDAEHSEEDSADLTSGGTEPTPHVRMTMALLLGRPSGPNEGGRVRVTLQLNGYASARPEKNGGAGCVVLQHTTRKGKQCNLQVIII
jgi:hypothetical protein